MIEYNELCTANHTNASLVDIGDVAVTGHRVAQSTHIIIVHKVQLYFMTFW